MSYQLPPLSDEYEFERLVRDILRREYNDPGIERFGRRGQTQHGIDGYSPSDSGVTFQCKLKDTRYQSDEKLRDSLLKELEEEFSETKELDIPVRRFIFASTFKNDTHLQQKASLLSTDSTTVEYWGWDTINEKIWEYPESLIERYFPFCPVRPVPGFRQITRDLIRKSKTDDADERNKLAIEYYRINDRDDVVFKVVCNDIDVRNARVMNDAFARLEALPLSGTVWILGEGGSGKTTILHRLALELAQRDESVYMLNLEAHLSNDDLESILSLLKYCSTSEQTVLCIDNPAADEEMLETLLRRIPDYCSRLHILFAERGHRYRTLQRTGCLTYLHGEEELDPISVRNTRQQRERVYDRLFDLLGVSDSDSASLREIVFNERLVYVNATYSILLELRRNKKIDFDFDWDDFRKTTADLPGFQEGYKYIALLYLFGVRAPFSVLSKLFGADEAQQRTFLERFRGLVNEPIVVDERRDDSGRKSIHVRTKHEIVSEIFFREHPELDKNELLTEWCEHTEVGDPVEAQALVNIFGARRNYLTDHSHIDFGSLIDFLLDGYLSEKVSLSSKLDGTLHLAKFWLLLSRNRVGEAIAVLEDFLRNSPENLHCRTELAKIYQRQNKLKEAEALLLESLAIDPKQLHPRTELAKIYQRQGKLKEAEAVLGKLLELEPNNLQARTELAKIYQRQDKLKEAEAVLGRLLELEPNNLQARTELAKIYQRQGKLNEAEAVLEKLLELEPNSLQARTELAKIYQRQGKLNEAEAPLLEVLEIKPNDLNSRTELAKIYQRQGKLKEAEALLFRALDIKTNDLNSRTELAKIYQRQNKLKEAEAVLRELLELEPNDLQARTELAKIYQRQGKLKEAEALLLEVLALKATDLNSRTELAKIYQRQNKLKEAEALLLESLEIDSKQLHPRTELAKIYQRQNKLKEAEALLLESLEIDSKQLHPRTELAKIYQRQGKLDEAVKRAEEALTIDPLNNHAVSELLGIWRRQGEKEKCASRFMEFITQPNYRFSRQSQAPVFRFFQCCSYFNMKEEADRVFQRFKSELDDQNLEYYAENFA